MYVPQVVAECGAAIRTRRWRISWLVLRVGDCFLAMGRPQKAAALYHNFHQAAVDHGWVEGESRPCVCLCVCE